MIDIRGAQDPASLLAARVLVREHVHTLCPTLDTGAIERIVAALPTPYEPPAGGLWVAWMDDAAVGCLALHALTTDVAELKRMYVRPDARGQGVARRLTEYVIATAAARGFSRLRLGTLPTMHSAQRLYMSLGFQKIEAYRSVEFGETWFYELQLGPS